MSEIKQKKNNTDLLHGPLLGPMLRFTFPLAASSMLQQLFNAADTAVVGRFCGSEAMAAVGSNSSVISLIIALFLGVSVGANVVIGRLIGGGHKNRISDAVHTVITVAFLSGILLLFAGFVSARSILELVGSPEDVIDLAELYLRIYFVGMPFIMLYNFGAAILRSMGDSRRPFLSLVAAGIINVVLNVILVVGFHLSVAGVAIATVISNAVSAAMIVWFLMREEEPFRLHPQRFMIEKNHLAQMLAVGVPAGVQGIVFSLSNTVIQSAVNGLGSVAMAGTAAAVTFDYICFYTVNAFNQTTMTYTSQNFAAKDFDRCKKIYRIALWGGILSCMAMNIFFVVGREFWIGLFTKDPAVMELAYSRLFHVLIFQWMVATYEIASSTMRGMNVSVLPAVLTIFGTCALRVIWVHVVFPYFGSYEALMSVYPVSWIVTGTIVTAAYFIVRNRQFREQPVHEDL
ncbi:putative efflux protein, MATE family [[Clostridium] aminophilum]|uniref:Putative efflux protein, MATE family n=1 Tax=[Clostridium] aminophilum TaxID=1526 RepID=A0A1I0EU56_9FIRM|nr:MATE family efflux transporter [[Clostridium] aminophilum]SET48826.1 putative efflux protein, MATE family [[Clostridium] aminophilum]